MAGELKELIYKALKEGKPRHYKLDVSNPSVEIGALESFSAFSAAVNWNEPFIVYVGILHGALLLLTIVATMREWFKVRAGLVFAAVLLVYAAEPINFWCSNNWQRIASQNYFDKSGVFTSVIWSMPLLSLGFIGVISMLVTSARLLVAVKRKELMALGRQCKTKENLVEDSASEVEMQTTNKDEQINHQFDNRQVMSVMQKRAMEIEKDEINHQFDNRQVMSVMQKRAMETENDEINHQFDNRQVMSVMQKTAMETEKDEVNHRIENRRPMSVRHRSTTRSKII